MSEKKRDTGAWRNFARAFKKGAAATGNGIKAIQRFGSDHIHYLGPILHGMIGHKLAGYKDTQSIRMSFRINGSDAGVRELPLAGRPGGARHDVVVFIHGMMLDEVLWVSPSRGRMGFGPMMEKDGGITPLYIRYNTGRHISHNGRDLSALLQEVTARYGKSIKSISLIGHSMGGLVAKSACYYACRQNHKWTKKLTHVFLLGAPNSGAYLEKIAHLTTMILSAIPNLPTRIVGYVFNQRSDGIKDLRWGYMADEDWQHKAANSIIAAHRTPVTLHPGVRYHVIAGTVGMNESSAVSQYFGDGLVGKKSAECGMDSADPGAVTCRVFPGTDHFSLVMSPEIYGYIISSLLSSEEKKTKVISR